MAWVYSLSIECGKEENLLDLSEILAFFSERNIKVNKRIYKDHEDNTWYSIYLDETVERKILNEIAVGIYNKLRSISGFRYALWGYEVDEFRTFTELIEDINDGFKFKGLVISEEIYNMIKEPKWFVKFADTYYWVPINSIQT